MYRCPYRLHLSRYFCPPSGLCHMTCAWLYNMCPFGQLGAGLRDSLFNQIRFREVLWCELCKDALLRPQRDCVVPFIVLHACKGFADHIKDVGTYMVIDTCLPPPWCFYIWVSAAGFLELARWEAIIVGWVMRRGCGSCLGYPNVGRGIRVSRYFARHFVQWNSKSISTFATHSRPRAYRWD